MGLHVIVGAGAVGRTTATLLAGRGERVRIVSRRGTGPEHPQVERVAADATDAQRLAGLAAGAQALYNCASPLYHRWFTDWPPLDAALLAAAERSGAVLATVSNVYGYGPTDAPITPQTPIAARHPKLRLRAEMWAEAKRLHEAGRIRATEVRGSDYIEANSIFSFVLREPLLAGRRAYVPAPLDVPHSWTSITDVARTVIAVAGDPRGHGEAWLVPTNPPQTIRQLATRFTQVAGVPAPKLTSVPYPVLWLAGLGSTMLRELRTTRYQFTRPFVLDSTLTERTFGLAPTDLDNALKSLVEQ
ncbi:MAG: NAD-dependent epimerase [Micromonosporaceae bacterium]|nr:NAD-dependent epimerase [Micromonosporaceae bacterium]